ncbi:MAG: XdhC family protein [Candidatus Poribacteria bacterium]
MREIYEEIPILIDAGQISAFCTVVDTKGSTPQTPGAKMLILPDFRIIGTLGGGCVEAEAKRQALGLMQSGNSKLLEFQLDNDYGWDDGSICGGIMKIFVDIPKSSKTAQMFTRLQELLDAKVPLVLATVVNDDRVNGNALGMKLLISGDEKFGGLGDERIEREVMSQAAEALEKNEPRLFETKDGAVVIFIEPIQPLHTLLIAGAGHVGQAVAKLGKMLDFEVVVADDRPDFASQERFPDADKIIVQDIAKTLLEFPIDPLTYIVIVTRGHQHDEEALYSVIDSNARYIGMIGSRRKIKLIFEDLIERGVSKERLQQVYSPIGLDINSKTVPEIAVSIAAQLVQVRNSKGRI